MKTQTAYANTIEASHHQEILQSRDQRYLNQIRSMMNGLDSSQQCLVTRISSKLNLKIQVSYQQERVGVKGILVHRNGLPVQIPEFYHSALQEKLERNPDRQSCFYYFGQHGFLNFFASSSLKSGASLSAHCFFNLIKKKLSSGIVQIGICKLYNKKSLQIKKARLLLLKSLKTILKKQNPELNVDLPLFSQHKGTVFKNCHTIDELSQEQLILPVENTSLKTGGYFQIQKKACSIIQEQGQKPKVVELAVKKLREQVNSRSDNLKKIERQLDIVNQIRDSRYSIKYWRKKQQDFSAIYMDYVPQTLDDHIHCSQISIKDFISLGEQVISGVQVLERSGIVHRDLKPENFLVEREQKNRKLKIIDFGQSALVSDEFVSDQQAMLGATIPYSPIQCYCHCKQGFNNKEIDYWSVGIILHEIVFKRIPIKYSRCFAIDIYKGWKVPDEFSIFPKVSKKFGLKLVEYVVTLMTIHSVCVDPKDRINLDKMERMMDSLKSYVNVF